MLASLQPSNSFAQTRRLTYKERAALCQNQLTAKIFNLMHTKQTNLAVAADVTTKAELLNLAEQVGPEICMLKTHIDLITDFDLDLVQQLKKISQKYNFLILEDRKFADIGSTVKAQFHSGIYKIAEWADLVTMHAICGEASIKALQLNAAQGVLLISQLSCQNNLIDDHYTNKVMHMAIDNSDLITGFIAQSGNYHPQFIVCMPGISIDQTKDTLGQNYNSPEYAIQVKQADVIIVGRAIYEAKNPKKVAQQFRTIGWQAYLNHLVQLDILY